MITTTEQCVHHWRLEEPNGRPAVAGECLKCGLVKYDFKTSEDRWGAGSGDDLHFIFSGPRRQEWW